LKILGHPSKKGRRGIINGMGNLAKYILFGI